MYYADIRQAEGKAKQSFTSEHLEKGIANDDEETFKHIASTLYGGGADTVGSVTMHHHQRLIVTVPPETDSLR